MHKIGIMRKEQALKELIIPKLKPDEELIGFFQAQYTPSFWWALLIGPLLFAGVKFYFVAVSNTGLHLHKLTSFGKADTHNYFPWNEITKLKLSKGFLQAPLNLVFSNGRKLKLQAQLKGVKKLAKLDDKTKNYLLAKS